jgi:hypothetical protein
MRERVATVAAPSPRFCGRGYRRAAGLAAALTAAALLAAACDGSQASGPGAGSQTDLAQALARFTQCMHSHGEPDFYFSHVTGTPDPGAVMGGASLS